jgi:hypothetical protein
MPAKGTPDSAAVCTKTMYRLQGPFNEVLEKCYSYLPEKGTTKRKFAGSGSDRMFAAAASLTSNEFARIVALLTGKGDVSHCATTVGP